MLIIRSDLRVADIYFGEFMRLFEHLYARYLARIIKARKKKAKTKTLRRNPADTWCRTRAGWLLTSGTRRSRAAGSTSMARGRAEERGSPRATRGRRREPAARPPARRP